MNQSNTCIVFYTHRLDEDVLLNYWKLKDECSPLYDVFFAYDNSEGDFKETHTLRWEEVYLYTMSDLASRKLSTSNYEQTTIFSLFDYKQTGDDQE